MKLYLYLHLPMDHKFPFVWWGWWILVPYFEILERGGQWGGRKM